MHARRGGGERGMHPRTQHGNWTNSTRNKNELDEAITAKEQQNIRGQELQSPPPLCFSKWTAPDPPGPSSTVFVSECPSVPFWLRKLCGVNLKKNFSKEKSLKRIRGFELKNTNLVRKILWPKVLRNVFFSEILGVIYVVVCGFFLLTLSVRWVRQCTRDTERSDKIRKWISRKFAYVQL